MSYIKEQLFHSIPKKTQPTLHSSHKNNLTTARTTFLRPQDVCPEVSDFNPHRSKQLYIHNLDIDYGRLQRPNHYYHDGPLYAKVSKMQAEEETPLFSDEPLPETRRFTGISAVAQQRQTQKKGKVRLVEVPQKTEESRPLSVQNPRKVKIRLTEVCAYEEKKEASKKRLHSRIVKMMVGGGKTQTRVICYPDNAEYLRLCGLK